MGNKTRRVNHASGAKANVSSQVVNHHGVRKVVMRAKCAIEAGAELQFDYMYGADARTCLRWRSRLQEPLDMTQSHGERMRGGVGAGEHSASAPEDDSGGDNSSSSPVVGDASKSKSKAGKAESKAKSKASKSKTESKATKGAPVVKLPTSYKLEPQTSPHPVPMEQDAPPTLPGQPPASPTIKYVYPDANTFEKGEIILCSTCKKNMKAPMRARALRCANCRSEIYPRHRKPGCADALYQQLQQRSPRSLSQGHKRL